MTLRRVLQVLAVASSLTLAGGFVYVKAGGVIPGLPFNVREERGLLPSSKVDALAPAKWSPEVISGSKSFSGTTTIEGGTVEPPAASGLLSPQLSDQGMLPGSKAPISPIIPDAWKPSTDVLPGFKSAVMTPSASVVVPPLPPRGDTAPDPTVIFGPKSAPIIDSIVPVPPSQEVPAPPPQSDPDEP